MGVAELKLPEKSASTERALDVTDNRITSRTAAPNPGGTLEHFWPWKCRCYIYASVSVFLGAGKTALAHLKLKSCKTHETGTRSDIPILWSLRNVRPSTGLLTLKLRPTYLVQGLSRLELQYLLSLINETKLSRHLSAIKCTYSFHLNICNYMET
jgi:hypothetical protein